MLDEEEASLVEEKGSGGYGTRERTSLRLCGMRMIQPKISFASDSVPLISYSSFLARTGLVRCTAGCLKAAVFWVFWVAAGKLRRDPPLGAFVVTAARVDFGVDVGVERPRDGVL